MIWYTSTLCEPGAGRRLKLHLSVARALESLAGEERGSGSPRLPLRHGCATRRGCARSRYAIRAWRHCLQQAALQQGISQLVRAEQALIPILGLGLDRAASARPGRAWTQRDNAGNRQRCLDAAAHRNCPLADQLAPRTGGSPSPAARRAPPRCWCT